MNFLEYSINEDFGILGFLYPDRKIYVDFLPPFHESKIVLIKTNAKVDSSKDCHYFSKASSKPLLNKQVFLDFLEVSGHKWAESQKQFLIALDDEEFWIRVKVFCLMGPKASSNYESEQSLFSLFEALFDSFSKTYAIYRKLNLNYKVVFSSLLTMMLKTRLSDMSSLSSSYVKVLSRNKSFISKYQKAVIGYIDSERQELDFIVFLFECARL